MARYRGPRLKVARALGVNVIYHPRLEGEKSRLMTPPGEHGKKRKKLSDYAVRLKEKQKLKAYYGLLERQFRRYVEKAFNKKGVTGDNLVIALETRLDNLAFRLGFGTSLRQARQMVNHGHILVNGKKVDIPSYACKPGDVISLREKSKKVEMFVENFTVNAKFKLDYLERDTDKLEGKLVDWPTRDAIPIEVHDSYIIEFYARMM
jgi:small subunit ribosomal protein S4